MFISLLCAHMKFHCAENLCYYTRDCWHFTVTGCPPVKLHAAIKGGWEVLPEAPAIWSHGLHLVFLLSPFWNLCSAFQQKLLQENLRVSREVPAISSCNPASLSGSMLACPCIFQWGKVSEDEWHLIVSYSWDSMFLGAQELPSLMGRLNLVATAPSLPSPLPPTPPSLSSPLPARFFGFQISHIKIFHVNFLCIFRVKIFLCKSFSIRFFTQPGKVCSSKYYNVL